MGWLAELLAPRLGANASVTDESAWSSWSTVGGVASSGLLVNAERSLQASAVWSCTRLIAESIASMPILVYRRLTNGGKERAPQHPLYEILHDSPNEMQTAYMWVRTMMVHALLYGGGYSRIVPGTRGAVDSLEPIHPDSIRTEPISGGIRYQVRGDDGMERPVNAEDILHLAGLSLDGTSGLSLVQYARESIGLALAAEGYSARFYSQDASPKGIIKHPGKLTPQAAAKLKESWQNAHSGLGNAHKTAVLEEGAEWVKTGMTNQDAELIAQLDWSAADIARFFNVPLHMIQLMTKTTSWGSGIEEMGIEFVVFSLLPWVKNWEQIITKRLIAAPQAYFAEFLLDSLMRGKLQERYSAYATGRQWGWLSVNDIRRLENLNPVPNGDGYLQPLNMTELGAEPEPSLATTQPAPQQAPQEEEDRPRNNRAQAHYQLLLHEAAMRVIRKEIAAMTKAAKRCAADAQQWAKEVTEFYREHTAFVKETLHINGGAAMGYCDQQAAGLIHSGAAIMEDWESRRVADLMALALGGAE